MADYKVRGLKSSDIDDCYMLLAENTKEYDENLDLEVLPKEFPTEEQFRKILINEGHTRAIVAENVVNNFSIFAGFAIFDINNSDFNILMLESTPKLNREISGKLIDSIINKAAVSKNNKIYFPISERKLELAQVTSAIGFKKDRMIFSANKPDVIIMKWTNK